MLRFESTIVAMFTGHSHNDKFQLFYRDEARTEAAVVNYVGPAPTPYTDSFPGIRVYEVPIHSCHDARRPAVAATIHVCVARTIHDGIAGGVAR